jgi:hypothetical protein
MMIIQLKVLVNNELLCPPPRIPVRGSRRHRDGTRRTAGATRRTANATRCTGTCSRCATFRRQWAGRNATHFAVGSRGV